MHFAFLVIFACRFSKFCRKPVRKQISKPFKGHLPCGCHCCNHDHRQWTLLRSIANMRHACCSPNGKKTELWRMAATNGARLLGAYCCLHHLTTLDRTPARACGTPAVAQLGACNSTLGGLKSLCIGRRQAPSGARCRIGRQ
jgi:hypothetical protein